MHSACSRQLELISFSTPGKRSSKILRWCRSEQRRWTQTSAGPRHSEAQQLGRISRYKMCLGDTTGENVPVMLRNSWPADFGAVQTDPISWLAVLCGQQHPSSFVSDALLCLFGTSRNAFSFQYQCKEMAGDGRNTERAEPLAALPAAPCPLVLGLFKPAFPARSRKAREAATPSQRLLLGRRLASGLTCGRGLAVRLFSSMSLEHLTAQHGIMQGGQPDLQGEAGSSV
nr:spermatogenesis-associated protein 2 isoform X4 [Columba livia]